jgi:hypothetical protein
VQEGDGKEEEITRDDIELRDAVGDNNWQGGLWIDWVHGELGE